MSMKRGTKCRSIVITRKGYAILRAVAAGKYRFGPTHGATPRHKGKRNAR